MADSPVPLCTADQFLVSAFADLASGMSAEALNAFLIEGTRLCEEETTRRLAPFTTTETHRAEGIDPDEYADSANLPMDLQGTLGRSYAYALGASTLVRHCWLNQYAPLYPEYWTYSNVSVSIVRSYGGSQNVAAGQIVGPDIDTGHMWFQLGTFLPIGSMIYATYSGGYTIAVPASLVRANKFMTAALIVRELDPVDVAHEPEELHTDALLALSNWERP